MSDDNETGHIVDFDLLEAAKENVQPLASGRRVTALSALFSTPHAEREAKLADTRNRLRINIQLALEDEDNDPLEAYCRLVYWTVENYPQGHSAESGLLELLEEATRVLKDDREGKWRAELRYLKLWILYASYVERPVIIYKFLFANDIGTALSPLYEEYAILLERDGRHTEADEAYTLGIARHAVPLDHLKNRHKEFQKRMMTSVSAAPVVAPVAPTGASSSSKRVVLGTSSTTTVPVTRPRVPSATTAPSNSRLQIFADPTGQLGVSPSLATPNPYPELGTRHSRVRENIPEVATLAGSTIRQAGRSKRVGSVSGSRTVSGFSSVASTIVPFRDPAPEESTIMGPPPIPVAKNKKMKIALDEPEPPKESLEIPQFTPFRDEPESSTSSRPAHFLESVMKVKKTAVTAATPLTEAEALKKDPLRNYALPEDDSAFSSTRLS